ncbi:MAG TPA: glycosyltransferase family 2 protein [Thermoanaerobaculia bacterium]|nr:glycosyltransferase family 2 protein [Thermoanaerobaculia bacterium]
MKPRQRHARSRRRGLPRIAAIVPAYNEHRTLGDVLRSLRSSHRVDEVLVVSDGSTDPTVDVARRFGVKVIHRRRNHGKGTAMAVGVAHTRARVLLFVDGDIAGLTGDHLAALMEPVLAGTVAMQVGIRNRGRLLNRLHPRTGPLLSGIRCLRREVFEAVPSRYLEGFRVETALNWACRRLRLRRGTVVLHGIRHLVKERKRGLLAGLGGRLRMFTSVFLAFLRLRLEPAPRRRRPLRPPLEPDLELINF